ncbi:hypothetical protein Hamer_G017808 [Homarus americanus]|uniref:Uncharacterized protein n=1 Tax=Homarus americanus TaxID=6706 RepID=A0A8J5N7K3_HOMAM|nr:hypothetical protein Hamer_G017808 [Homarus americanus]
MVGRVTLLTFHSRAESSVTWTAPGEHLTPSTTGEGGREGRPRHQQLPRLRIVVLGAEGVGKSGKDITPAAGAESRRDDESLLIMGGAPEVYVPNTCLTV